MFTQPRGGRVRTGAAVVAVRFGRRGDVGRWSLVALTAAALITVPLVVTSLPASVEPVSSERLRQLIMGSAGQPYQGYAETTGLLALPDLPNLTDVTSLLNDTTKVRAWYDSPDRWRFDVISAAGERDVYRTPEAEFVWDYGRNLLTKLVGGSPVRLPHARDLLPPDLARLALTAAGDEPLDELPAQRVAGVSAAGLRIRPADPDTAVGRVDIWADPTTGLPVRVDVSGRGADQPVLISQFVQLSQTRPASDVLVPAPPGPGVGYTVTTSPDINRALGTLGGGAMPARLAGRDVQTAILPGVPAVGVYGTGLSSFAAMVLPRNVAGRALDTAGTAGAVALQVPGGDGALLTVPPISVVIVRSTAARRSYLLAGLVNASVLQAAAAELVSQSGAGS